MVDSAELRAGVFERFFGRLRFPQLFALAAVLFVVDLFIPDLIPFADEILLGMMTTLFASLKNRNATTQPAAPKPAEKDITPRD